MKIRAMENIPSGFQHPATQQTPVYRGDAIACNTVADVEDAAGEMLVAAGVAEKHGEQPAPAAPPAE